MRTFSRLVLALLPLVAMVSSARAQLVPESQCMKRPCNCADGPIIEEFMKAQRDSLNAWKDVLDEFFSLSAPGTRQEARDSYAMKVSPRATLLNQCPQWGGRSIQLGGLDQNGDPIFDQCFCNTFCDKIVDSVELHEKRHFKNQIVLVSVALPSLIISAIPDALGANRSEAIRAQLLTLSEIDAHQTQVDQLNQDLKDLLAADRTCTWMMLSPASARSETTRREEMSRGFFDRVRTLAKRVVHGAK